ncbi:hypothetical protein GCM10010508_26290 [Streptomyces naganishii JCM 4654]|uniref:Uncharacterized protein n=1 Tax=Streptomyces naganishii JCM 4654 TaxID=1306179 RepID=A0A918Y2Y8_9ACTN|nr:hypothetical protein GCM10010508_26290 [Streptomyces naganishii JCM 4654]
MAAMSWTIRLTQHGVPGVYRVCARPFGPAGSGASVIVTLFSAPCGGRLDCALRAPEPMLAPPVVGRAPGASPGRCLSGGCPVCGFLPVSMRLPTDVDRLYSTCPIPYAS